MNTQHQVEIQKRRHTVAHLYLQRKTQMEIAATLGIGQQLVSYDLRVLQALWLKESLQDFDQRKAVELQRVDSVECEAWAAWERSKLPREITLTEATDGGNETPRRKASVRKEGQAGDPRFLQTIQKCIDQRCAILGLGEEQASLKAASQGLASLLDQARQPQPPPARPAPFAEA